MDDLDKTKTELVQELVEARQRIAALEMAAAAREVRDSGRSTTLPEAQVADYAAELALLRDRAQTYFEMAGVIFVVLDSDGIIVQINKAGCEILGYSQEELLGKNWFDTCLPESWKQIMADGHMVGVPERAEFFENSVLTKSGEERSIVWNNIWLTDKDGNPIQSLSSGMDITDRKQAEQEHMELLLERERVQILANFITQASHEFRTPLSIINTSMYLIQQKTDVNAQRRHFQNIRNQIDGITTLITDLIAMAKLDGSHHLDMGQVELNAVIHSVHHTLSTRHPDKTRNTVLALTDGPLLIPGNLDAVQQAIECMWHNAIRFTTDGGTITVGSAREEGFALIEITDDGVGIRDDALPHIYERFYRADEANTTRGFGLGLPIAKRSVELHGGRIEVQSTVGKGSTFRVLLPLK